MKQIAEVCAGGEALTPKRLPLRTKTGCLTCRQRRKKCDEKKPQCSGCARNYLDCTWPSKPSKKGSPIASPGGSHFDTGNAYHSSSSPTRVVVLNQPQQSPKTKARYAVASHDQRIGHQQELERVVQWVPRLMSFVGAERAAWLTPCSGNLLQHYLQNTSTFLTTVPSSCNPFINIIMPLSYSDDLLMHSILALSGTHLSFERGNDVQVQLAAHKHYQLLLKSLRALLVDPDFGNDVSQLVRLILTLVVVCHVEAVGGEPNGGIFPHLKACRILILKLLHDHDIHTLGSMKEAAGFAIETYLYLALTNSITPFGRDEARTVPFDPFFSSLDVLDDYGTYGHFFSCGRTLFEYIPQIAKLAATRLAEEEVEQFNRSAHTDTFNTTSASETLQTYQRIIAALEAWKSPPVNPRLEDWQFAHECTGEGYRQSLIIFAKASMCGSLVSAAVAAEIQGHVKLALTTMWVAASSPFVTVLLWPVMIVGSCCIVADQQDMLQAGLVGAYGINTNQLVQAGNLLRTLWSDDDPHAYGPFGLELVMKKYNINFSMG